VAGFGPVSHDHVKVRYRPLASRVAARDNDDDMFLAATTLVLISVGINLPTTAG
jgi:hypothetical protein